jgi:hypothetical protein
MMAEGDRLRDLQMRESRHDRGVMLFGQIDQGGLQGKQQRADIVDRLAQPQPDIGCHLVIARAGGVQAFAGIADQFGQTLLDIQMHVFKIE